MGPVGHRGRGSEVPLPVLQGKTGEVEETGELIVKTMKEFIDGLRLKGDPKSQVGWPAENRIDRYYIPYLLGIADCPDIP